MKIYFIVLCTSALMLFSSCINNIDIDNKARISGIIDACKNSPQTRTFYLKQKVENKQISQIVSYTIQECLK